MLKPVDFVTATLSSHVHGSAAQQIMAAAVNSVDPKAAVKQHLKRDGNYLMAGDFSCNLNDIDRIVLIGIGKAAVPMTKAVQEVLKEHITSGILITKYGHTAGSALQPGITIFEAGHPIPDQAGVEAASVVLEMIKNLNKRDLVICLVSGGGSALLVAPAKGTNLSELQKINGSLLAAGANIHEINSIRKHLSAVKGGQLASLAQPAQVVTLILSDVVGDSLDAIASGPTVPDPGYFADAVSVLENHGLKIPGRLIAGANGEYPETPKPEDPLFDRVHNVLVGSNRIAAAAALEEANRLGYTAKILTTTLTGEALEAGAWFANHILEMQPNSIWIVGGETTVSLGNTFGSGGRNQEAALAAVKLLAGKSNALMITLATDGGDGPTDAAGAVASSGSFDKGKSLGLDPNDFLVQHDSYHFFDALGDLIKTNPTQTNVNDIWLLFT